MINLNWSGYIGLTAENVSGLPTYPCVYKLATYYLGEKKYHPFYVGQAGDIRVRTQQHASRGEENPCVKSNFNKYTVYINYAYVGSQGDRNAVEVALYNYYKPKCNDSAALPKAEPASLSSYN